MVDARMKKDLRNDKFKAKKAGGKKYQANKDRTVKPLKGRGRKR